MKTKKRSLKYCVLDVFTTERYKGNPLAVVFTEGDLEEPDYKDISREFGYSETSFMYYSNQDKALKVRSFTPTGFEINGAGHNLLGAVCAALLKKMAVFREQNDTPYVLMKDKPIPLLIKNGTTNELPVVGMTQQSAVLGSTISPGIIAEALSLPLEGLSVGNLKPTVVTTEVSHLMVPIKNLEMLNKALPNKVLLSNLANEYGFQGVYCFVLIKDNQEHIAETRFFNPGIGIDEDAATGSAAGPLAGFLYLNQFIDKNTDYQVLQGKKMNHPSTIQFRVEDNGIVISGTSIITMEGTLYI